VSRYVHDDLYVKALAVQRGGRAWALISADLVGVDAVAVNRIRRQVAEQTGLAPEAILVCATHCHSGPIVCPVGSATDPSESDKTVVQADGSVPNSYGGSVSVSSTAYYVGQVDEAWKESFISQAAEAAVAAWESLRPAEVAFGRARVEGVASSRRVYLSDGTWADPRRESSPEAEVVSRSEIDPFVRVLVVREQETKAPLSAVINYGSHPWIFSISGFSAELVGATAREVAARWGGSGYESPVVLYTTGPEGDATLIWNVDTDRVWKTRPGESQEESLARRQKGFDRELERLGGLLADGVMEAMNEATAWDAEAEVDARRREVELPLKKGYERPADVLVAEWQKKAPEGRHLTEIQLLRVGDGAVLGLPGEPFTSLGDAIRAQSPFRHLLIAALANDFGAVSYSADRAAYDLGGYEVTMTPVAPEGGERLVEDAIELLHPASLAEHQPSADSGIDRRSPDGRSRDQSWQEQCDSYFRSQREVPPR
jgi:hypothetical protein